MKVNSILLIVLCLLQVLNSSTVGLNEQSLKDAATKTLKYARVYHQKSIKLTDKGNFNDIKLNYPSLISNNIQFRFDEYGLLHIKFVNLKVTLTGKYNFHFPFVRTNHQVTAKLNNFSWEQVFVISKNELGNGKLDIKFKPTEESKISYNMAIYNSKNKDITNFNSGSFHFIENIKNEVKNLDYNPLKNQLKKIAQLFILKILIKIK